MAGIYIHIPFCKTRCSYCDFFSTTNESIVDEYVSAVCLELVQRKDDLNGESISTIYFGGGTPSQLSIPHFAKIFEVLYKHYEVETTSEITVEVNPDDITAVYVEGLRQLPFNRISMGVQSFDDADLVKINRRHNAQQAIDVVERCRQAGFDNISIDLIYGLPNQTLEKWKKNVDKACLLSVEHISAYHLIYEKGTRLYQQLKKGAVAEADEELSVEMFKYLKQRLSEAGYDHYEISNFALEGRYSMHNSSYWNGTPYLGIGASAHSYDGRNRWWNEANMKSYLSQAQKGQFSPTIEDSTLESRYNDFVIVSLRTKWGVELIRLEEEFGVHLSNHFKKEAERFLQNGWMKRVDNRVVVTDQGQFVSDSVLMALIYIEED